MLAAEVGLAR